MKLLIVTQTIDRNDPVLGFFHRWVEEFAKHCERIEVICLKEGEYDLPKNVIVHSLGKEKARVSRFRYGVRFLKLVWMLRRQYGSVLVHMNQEYVLLGGWFWKLLGKRIYMWRNHYAGSLATDIAALFCNKIFCTSKFSYSAKYRNTILMPVGVDTGLFKPAGERVTRTILSLGRIAPSKNIRLILAALKKLNDEGVNFSASIYGDALPQDTAYLAEQKDFVRDQGLSQKVHFYPGVPNRDTPAIYSRHEIFVNASRSGMFDKTIFEAAACGAVSLASSDDWKERIGADMHFSGIEELKLRILFFLESRDSFKKENEKIKSLVESNSLRELGQKLYEAIRD